MSAQGACTGFCDTANVGSQAAHNPISLLLQIEGIDLLKLSLMGFNLDLKAFAEYFVALP